MLVRIGAFMMVLCLVCIVLFGMFLISLFDAINVFALLIVRWLIV